MAKNTNPESYEHAAGCFILVGAVMIAIGIAYCYGFWFGCVCLGVFFLLIGILA